jgi:transketolase
VSTVTDLDLRPDVVSRCHGEPRTVPPGPDCDAVNTLRFLAADALEHAGSGHPGTAMALAPLAYRLYTRELRHDPADPDWPDRDRFVLSSGHASILQYSCLHLSGYDLPLSELKRLRTLGSRTPGHPERGNTPGVEVTTGPLGQGISMAVGMAIAERMLAARFNRDGHRIVDHRTWVIAGDGDLMEGVAGEAASLAGHLGLDRLTVFYDDNHISIEGSTDLAFCEQVADRFAAYGWHVTLVDDVNDLASIDAAVADARAEQKRPTLIIVRSHIGYGSPKQGSAAAHGVPLGAKAVAATRARLGWTYGPFEVPDSVYDTWRSLVAERSAQNGRWRAAFLAYAKDHPELAAEFQRMVAGRLPDGWDDTLPEFDPGHDALATRKAFGAALNAVAARIPELVGGSADLAPSTNTTLEGEGDISRGEWTGRNFHFGVREHAMGAVLNGLAAHGGVRVFGATFLVFSDYLRPALRLSALMQLPVLYVFTHDSIGLGEDGPTHQPVEHLASLRAIPGLTVLRPADANETSLALAAALAAEGPVALVLSRQNLPILEPGDLDPAGSQVADGDEATIVSTGSEVHVALRARALLGGQGIRARVVSVPSWELFRRRPAAERERVLPPGPPVVAVEAGSPQGWCEFADVVVGLDRFGASGSSHDVYEHLGITPQAVADQVHTLHSART